MTTISKLFFISVGILAFSIGCNKKEDRLPTHQKIDVKSVLKGIHSLNPNLVGTIQPENCKDIFKENGMCTLPWLLSSNAPHHWPINAVAFKKPLDERQKIKQILLGKLVPCFDWLDSIYGIDFLDEMVRRDFDSVLQLYTLWKGNNADNILSQMHLNTAIMNKSEKVLSKFWKKTYNDSLLKEVGNKNKKPTWIRQLSESGKNIYYCRDGLKIDSMMLRIISEAKDTCYTLH